MEENDSIEKNIDNTQIQPETLEVTESETLAQLQDDTAKIETQPSDADGGSYLNDSNVDLVTISPVEFSSFDEIENKLSANTKNNLDILQDIKMRVTVELGRAKCSVKKILDFQKGSIVELNKVAGEQVELYANGKFVAYGEVIVIEDKFGLRVTSIAHQNNQSG